MFQNSRRRCSDDRRSWRKRQTKMSAQTYLNQTGMYMQSIILQQFWHHYSKRFWRNSSPNYVLSFHPKIAKTT